MKSISETGHAKNAANLKGLITYCTAYGEAYNPGNTDLSLTALNSLYSNLRDSLNLVNTASSAYTNAVDAREAAFEGLSKLTTRLINALAASTVPKEAIADAKTIARKMQGRRASKIQAINAEAPQAETHKNISVSQLSYDNRIENFDKLIQHLTSHAGYAPNETDLKVSTLSSLSADLKTKNAAVVASYIALSNARIVRNKILYGTDTAVFQIAGEVKKYIKSVFGATSPQYKQISTLKFTNAK